MEVYKIRRKSDGLFSQGGTMSSIYCASGGLRLDPNRVRMDRGKLIKCSNRWSDKGKNWNALHHLKAHIRQNIAYYIAFGDDIEVVKSELVETEVLLMVGVCDEVVNRKQTQNKEREKSHKKLRLEQLKSEQIKIESELEELEGEQSCP